MGVSLVVLLFGALLALFVRLLRSSGSWQGTCAEGRVAGVLAQLTEEYHVFNDVYVRTRGRSVQIDHIVISRYGLFVIETKNYQGAVYGTEHAEYWAQYSHGNQYKFYSPIRQNTAHARAICTLLHLRMDCVFPIVVFAGSADVRCSANSHVVYLSQLLGLIDEHRDALFTDEQVLHLSEMLTKALVTDDNRRREHIDDVQRQVAEKHRLEDSGICPRCHGQLLVREGRYGHFIGCSNYPKCKYTAQLN